MLCVTGYVARVLATESAHIDEDRRQIAKHRQETASLRAQNAELRSQARPLCLVSI